MKTLTNIIILALVAFLVYSIVTKEEVEKSPAAEGAIVDTYRGVQSSVDAAKDAVSTIEARNL